MKYSEARDLLKKGMWINILSNGCSTHQKPGEDIGRYRIREAGHNLMCAAGEETCELEILTEADGVTPWKSPRQNGRKYKRGDRVVTANGDVITLTEPFKSGSEFAWHSQERIRDCASWTEDYITGYAKDSELIPEQQKESSRGLIPDGLIFGVHNIDFFNNNMIVDFGYETTPKKGFIMKAVDTIKKLALQVNNNDEFQLREAGLHDSDGDLTEDGKELMEMYLEKLVLAELVQAAKDINAAKEKK